MEELLPDKLKRLWGKVEGGRLSAQEFNQEQDRLLSEYRHKWEQALLMGASNSNNLQESALFEICAYFGKDVKETMQQCSQALSNIKGEWHQKVHDINEHAVERFYDESKTMLYELMWWHTLAEDLSPLAYVAALEFSRLHECTSYLDFGSGVGSGGILFARHGFQVTLADISSTALNFGKWRFNKRRLLAEHIDLKTRELPSSSFDIITAMDVFEHLVDPVKVVKELWRALKAGGFLFGRFHAESDEDRPHHIILDFEPTMKELKRLGFVRVWQDEWLWGHEVFQKSSV